MQTRFTQAQLAEPEIAAAEKILRTCVHCGFCTATCPTYRLLGDERDSPRGRIVLIQTMLETGGAPDAETVTHLDRCLSCLGCTTTCPSGVDYMHLIDQARVHVARHYRRPLPERALRGVLRVILPRPRLFGLLMALAGLVRWTRAFLPRRLGALFDLVPTRVHGPSPLEAVGAVTAEGERRMRVALSLGCVQRPLAPEIAEASARVLARFGAEVVVPRDLGCCGAIDHHMGAIDAAQDRVRRNLDALSGLGPIDRLVATASGCGTMFKDYGTLLAEDPARGGEASALAGRAADITEVLRDLGYRGSGAAPRLRVAYHAACSLEHGQKVKTAPRDLLRAAGFEVVEVPDGHLCCGSAGTYNLLQPDIARALKEDKLRNLARTGADVIAAGNIGCMRQLMAGAPAPIVHVAELLDWASGGPRPLALAGRVFSP